MDHDRTGLERLERRISSVVVARDDVVRLLLVGVLCEGHILLEDAPGTGKTLLSKTVSRLVDGRFGRVQATPDLLPSDVTGGSIYNQATRACPGRPAPGADDAGDPAAAGPAAIPALRALRARGVAVCVAVGAARAGETTGTALDPRDDGQDLFIQTLSQSGVRAIAYGPDDATVAVPLC